jgi:hypothetical protein
MDAPIPIGKTMPGDEKTEKQDELKVLFTSENIGLAGEKSHWEQLKFVFAKLEEWLLKRKEEILEQIKFMLDRLRHLYPRAYEIIMNVINAQLRAYMGQQIQPQLAHPPPQQPLKKILKPLN